MTVWDTSAPGDGWLTLERVRQRGGYLKESEVATIANDPQTRLAQMLVRCGGCRFVCAAQDVAHLIAMIEKTGDDYVRDVSIPVTL